MKTKIFIIEDEKNIVSTYRRLLCMDYEIIGSAESGEEAINKISEQQPDIILADIKINGVLDGIDTAEYIQSKYNIPVIFITGYFDNNLLKRAEKLNTYSYLYKPCSFENLISSIEMTLYKKNADKIFLNSIKESYAYYKAIYNNELKLEDLLLIDINKNFEQMFNINYEIRGQNLSVLYAKAPNEFQGFIEQLSVLNELNSKIEFEFFSEIQNKWYSIIAYPPKEDYLITLIIDITENKTKDKQVLDYYITLNLIPSIVVLTDSKGNINYANPAFENITGYGLSEIIGKHISLMKYADQDRAFIKDLWSAIEAGKEWRGEFCNKKKNGEIYWESAIISAVKDLNGNILNYIKTAEDITARKNYELELKNIRIYQENMIQTINDCLIVIGADAKIKTINKETAQLLGYIEGELINKPIGTILAAAAAAAAAFTDIEIQRIIEAGYVRDYNIKFKTKTGELIPVSLSGAVMRDSENSILGITCIARDIRQQLKEQEALKLSEQKLRESKQRYEKIVENSPDSVCRWLPDTTLTFVNAAYCKRRNKSREELLGKKWIELADSNSHEYILKMMPEIINTKKSVSYLAQDFNEEKTWHWTNTPILDTNGEVIEVQSTASDVSELINTEKYFKKHIENLSAEKLKREKELETINELLKKINQKLKESEDKISLITDNLKIGIFRISPKAAGKFLYFNKGLADIYNCYTEELENISLKDLYYNPDDRQILFDELKNNGYLKNVEIILKTKQGKKIICLCSAKVKYKENCEIDWIDGIIEDITYRKKIEAEAHNKQLQLIQSGKLASLGQLAAGIAHEINQPLAGVSMSIDNILNKLNKKTLQDDYLHNKCSNIMNYIERIKSIIEHIRIFSREQREYQGVKFNVCASIKNATSMLKTQYANHNINLKTEFDANEKYIIFGNEYKMEQILLNLLSNAKDAVDEKSEKLKKIAASNQFSDSSYKKEIKILINENIEDIELIIEDNGAGIKKESIDLIFDPFFTTKAADKGTGLGLSITHSLVTEMHGEIAVETSIDEFTRFILKFPKA